MKRWIKRGKGEDESKVGGETDGWTQAQVRVDDQRNDVEIKQERSEVEMEDIPLLAQQE